MSHDVFFEQNGYAISCFTHQREDGQWIAWALFERLKDFTEMKTKIPGMRHNISAEFQSREEAVDAISSYALKTASNGDVGL